MKTGEIKEVLDQGFNPSEVVCPECIKKRRAIARKKNKPFEHCLYKQETEATNKSDRIAATHQRYLILGRTQCRGKTFISIQEDAVSIVAPLVDIRVDFRQIRDFINWMFGIYTGTCRRFLEQLHCCMNRLANDCAALDGTTGEISVPQVDPLRRVSQALYDLMESYRIAPDWEYHAEKRENDRLNRENRGEEPDNCKPLPRPWQDYAGREYDFPRDRRSRFCTNSEPISSGSSTI